MNNPKLKMSYVGVLSSKPRTQTYRSTFKYFGKYLITLGDAALTQGWSLMSVMHHAKKILFDEEIKDAELMIDSGGFQIIVDKIVPNRIHEYIECYHMVLDTYHEKIEKIFSLDVNNFKMTSEQIYDWNVTSTRMTIDAIKKHPDLRNKVLFVLQNRNLKVFEIWRKLFIEEKAYEHFDLYSIGGLVGLKRDTKVDFNHAVPATLWLLTYSKHFNFEVKQLHLLGQSSKVIFIIMALLEKLYDVYFTADSSELIRFAPISQKLPLIRKVVKGNVQDGFKEDFEYARDMTHVEEMLHLHSWDDDKCIRANRENLRALEIDIDILELVPQDLLDYIIHFNFTSTPGYTENMFGVMKENAETIKKICDALIRICNPGTGNLTLEDLIFVNLGGLNEEALKTINEYRHLSREDLVNIIPNDSTIMVYFDALLSIRGFRYKNQRSKLAQDYFTAHDRRKLDNCDQIELVCQHIDSAMLYADVITDEILKIGLENITIENLKELHPIMAQGKTAKTTFQNIGWILRFKDVLENGDIDGADDIMRELVLSYEK